MTTIELQQWRESFVERYLNKIDDMVIAEVRKSVEDAREGRVTSSEDLDKEIETWF